ncbi:MAG: DUF4097 domain-containing protein [Lactobacillus sp.]|nr:DUF4097 domain-containing protein [Lactobacillus sp.]
MKNISKRFSLIPLLFILAMMLSACSIIISNHDDTKPEIKTTITNKGFNKLAVSVALSDISVKYGDKYSIEYEGPKKLKPNVSRKDGLLTIKQSATGIHHVNGNPVITITIPKQLLKKLILSTNDGDIEVENIATTSPISLETNDGDIDINNLKAPSGKINTNDGDIKINKLSSKNGFKVNTDDGDIKITLSSFTGYKLNISDGDIKVKNRSSNDFFVENPNSSNVLTASTQDGDIKIK